MAEDNRKDHIVWIDLELTGLDIDTCQIIEVACIITDKNLNVVSEEFSIVIHLPDEILFNMNKWCIHHHSKSGLIEESRSSKISLKDAEQMLLNFCKKYVPEGTCPIGGSSVYMDHWFLQKYMPLACKYLHYRIIDVSSIKELARRWNPELYKNMPNELSVHRALPDIKSSLECLLYFKKHFFSISNSL